LGSDTRNGLSNITIYNGVINTIDYINSTIYVGGYFNTILTNTQNISVNNIAVWNRDTSTWSILGSATQNGTNNSVNSIKISGTSVYVGGDFDIVSSNTQNISANNIAIWNTNTSTWSILGSATQNGTNKSVNSIKISGTSVYVGGRFDKVSSGTQNNVSGNYIAIWQNNTSWVPLGSAMQNGTNYHVRTIEISGTSVYVGGGFNKVFSSTQNISANGICIWRNSSWVLLGSATDNGVDGVVNAIKILGTNVYVGGGFTKIPSGIGYGILNIARWNTNTSTWSELNNEVNACWGAVHTIEISGTSVYVGGNFGKIVKSSNHLNISYDANNFAVWDTITSTWSLLYSNSIPGFPFEQSNTLVTTINITNNTMYIGIGADYTNGTETFSRYIGHGSTLNLNYSCIVGI